LFTSNPAWSPGEARPAFAPEALNFMVIGDWGVKGSEFQKEVAQSLAYEAQRDSSRFIISTGDNFYDSGVENLADEHWNASYESIYTAPSLYVPWYVILGNHDYEGNIQAQIDYTARSPRWRLPAPYYTVEKRLEDGTSVLFVFIDTNPLVERTIDPAEVTKSASAAAAQLNWLDDTLARTNADWKFVVGHHPLYAVGEKHQDNEVLIENLASLLVTREVDVYLSGHAHSLQHVKADGGIDYFISGSGGKVRPVTPDASTLAALAVPGFLAISVYPDHALAQFVDLDGGLQYETRIDR
jgi:3',5'-cyclic AMP phosphodiesterase CpdA